MKSTTLKQTGNILLGILMALLVFSAVGYLGHVEREELSQEQTENTQLLMTQVVRLRYIVDCLHVSPPTERNRTTLLTCASEARPLTYADANRIDLLLAANIGAREDG